MWVIDICISRVDWNSRRRTYRSNDYREQKVNKTKRTTKQNITEQNPPEKTKVRFENVNLPGT